MHCCKVKDCAVFATQDITRALCEKLKNRNRIGHNNHFILSSFFFKFVTSTYRASEMFFRNVIYKPGRFVKLLSTEMSVGLLCLPFR